MVEQGLPAGAGRKFVLGCALLACLLLAAGRAVSFPVSLLAAEVFATILGLFLFGSFKYQIHKNALTYGMLLVIVATFCGLSTSGWHLQIAEQESFEDIASQWLTDNALN